MNMLLFLQTMTAFNNGQTDEDSPQNSSRTPPDDDGASPFDTTPAGVGDRWATGLSLILSLFLAGIVGCFPTWAFSGTLPDCVARPFYDNCALEYVLFAGIVSTQIAWGAVLLMLSEKSLPWDSRASCYGGGSLARTFSEPHTEPEAHGSLPTAQAHTNMCNPALYPGGADAGRSFRSNAATVGGSEGAGALSDDEDDPVSSPGAEDESPDQVLLDDIFAPCEDEEVFNEEVDYRPTLRPPEEEPHLGGATRNKRKVGKKVLITDERTDDLLFCPGAEVNWSLDTGIAQRIPVAFRHKLREKAASRLVTNHAAAAATALSRVLVEFLYDSGCRTTQIPAWMKPLLDDVHDIAPIELDTAGTNPVINEAGTLRFRLQGVKEEIALLCHVNPHSTTPLLSLDALERKDRGRIHSTFWKNEVNFKGVIVPIVRRHDSPFLRLIITSGTEEGRKITQKSSRTRGAALASTTRQTVADPYGFVHKLCAHANPDCCKRTAAKAKGLPSLTRVCLPTRPCPECALAKMKAVSKGQGQLSTGHAPTRPGQVMCGDCFGPIQIPGLAGERYFIILVCQFTRWGVVRSFTTLDQVPSLVEEMIAEVRATLDDKAPEHVSLTLHTDNASVFSSAKHQKRMGELNVHLTYSAPYEARTNAYAERFGGILIAATRAMLLEGNYPPKFWSIMVRHACWTINRLVRPDGNAPIETFTGKEIDFSHVHPTGTLCYWHVEKRQRDDPKLGMAAAVGVYLGPGAAFGMRGHMVYTANEKLRCVSHVLVDPSTKPFQLGMLKELMKKSYLVTAVYDKAQIDPSAFILPSGDSAFNYIGLKVRKKFDDGLWYEGVVQTVVPVEDDEDASSNEIYFRAVYSDGDVEDYTLKELKSVLVNKGKEPACAAASCSAERELDTDSVYCNTDDLETPGSLDGFVDLVYTASQNVAAAAASRSNKPEGMPHGETYSWMKVFKMSTTERAAHAEAMQAEIDKLTSAGHARWERLPPGEVAIPSVGVFRVKMHDLHHGGHTLKARFCANGQAVSAPPGGWDASATVASSSQLLTVIALATQMDLQLAQIDVKSAFTQVKLKDDERIWIKPLPGLGDPERQGRVLRLLHHLYGHPLANAAFQELWVSVMQEFGFEVVDASGTVFSYERGGKRMLVATVVDDSLVAYSHETLFSEFQEFLKEKFPITVSPVETICGMHVVRNADGSISVDQKEYIEKKAAAFDCVSQRGRAVLSPMSERFVLGPRPDVPDLSLVAHARELMGSLIYATLTRPECKYACSKLASVVTNPTEVDIGAMKRVLRYLYASRSTSLTFRPGSWTGPDGAVHSELELSAFVDAGFAQEAGRKSQTGFALMLAGAAIFAKSGKQTQVTDSTPYSETIALHEASNWVIVTRNLLKKMFAPQNAATRIYEDNEAATIFARKGPGPRSLHWDVKLEYVHELHTAGIINVSKIDTKLQIADVLTKALCVDMHLALSALLLGGPVKFD